MYKTGAAATFSFAPFFTDSILKSKQFIESCTLAVRKMSEYVKNHMFHSHNMFSSHFEPKKMNKRDEYIWLVNLRRCRC